jgi:hypothetical protein
MLDRFKTSDSLKNAESSFLLRKVTKMVPKLKPKHECTLVPKEFCNVRLGIPKTSRRPLQSLWCLDETLEVDNSGYDDNNGIVHK